MTLDRRTFCQCMACFAAAALLPTRIATADAEPEFLCSVVDDLPSDEFSIEGYADTAGAAASAVVSVLNEFAITPYGTMFLDHRWLRSHGRTKNTGVITLGVHFIEATSDQRETVESLAPQWLEGELGRTIAFQFGVDADHSEIRIAFDPGGGNNSKVGRKALGVSKSRRTMNLAQTTRRAVLHEFGHALGLQHEHAHPASGIVWNEEVVIAELRASQGWTPEYIRANVINRYGKEAACIGDPQMNRDSIMMYEIPARWTKNGFSTKLTRDISDRDRRCLEGVYKT